MAFDMPHDEPPDKESYERWEAEQAAIPRCDICGASLCICEKCGARWCLDHQTKPLVCPGCGDRGYP